MKENVRELLRPFFGWEPELKPVLPDLKKRAKMAIFSIFGQDLPGVIAVSKSLILFWPGRRIPFWQKLESELDRELRENLTQVQVEEISLKLQENLPFGPEQKGVTIENKLWENLEGLWYTLDQYTLRSEMQLNLWYSLFLAAGFYLAGDKEKNFQPLFDLWLKGNFPAWFDRQGKLVVLCRQPF